MKKFVFLIELKKENQTNQGHQKHKIFKSDFS
jgi:hypothetical protein